MPRKMRRCRQDDQVQDPDDPKGTCPRHSRRCSRHSFGTRGCASSRSWRRWPARKPAGTRSSSGRARRRSPRRVSRWPSWRSLRVVLSMAAMWSASNACRRPKVGRQSSRARQRRIAVGVVEKHAPPNHVQEADGAPEPGQPPPLVSGHRSRPGPASASDPPGNSLTRLIRRPRGTRFGRSAHDGQAGVGQNDEDERLLRSQPAASAPAS